MRLPRTLFLSLSREIVLYGMLGFAGITSVLVSQNVLRRLDELLVVGFTLRDFLLVLKCLVPMLTAYAVPIAFFFGALLTLRRLSSNSEILAMQSCGLGQGALLLPTITIAVLVTALTAHLMLNVEFEARRELRSLFTTVAARGNILQAGTFRVLGSRVIYVDSRNRQDELEGIMISDASDEDRPFVIFAEKGRLDFDLEKSVVSIELQRGDLHLEPRGQENSYQRISFEHFDYSFDARELTGPSLAAVRPKQMSIAELQKVVRRAERGEALDHLHEKNPIEYSLEVHRRYALPVAPLLFGLLAVPLGSGRSSRSGALSVALCAVVVFVYYALVSFSGFLARSVELSPVVALWLPNLLFAVCAVFLLARSRRVPAS